MLRLTRKVGEKLNFYCQDKYLGTITIIKKLKNAVYICFKDSEFKKLEQAHIMHVHEEWHLPEIGILWPESIGNRQIHLGLDCPRSVNIVRSEIDARERGVKQAS